MSTPTTTSTTQNNKLKSLGSLALFLPLVGYFVWTIKVQGALNDFWRSKGALSA
jgi:hypothetical protein